MEAPGTRPPTAGAVPLDAPRQKSIEAALKRIGALCGGCGDTLEGGGWEYLGLQLGMQDGTPVAAGIRAYACNRPECDFRERLRPEAIARRPIDNPYEILLEADE